MGSCAVISPKKVATSCQRTGKRRHAQRPVEPVVWLCPFNVSHTMMISFRFVTESNFGELCLSLQNNQNKNDVSYSQKDNVW